MIGKVGIGIAVILGVFLIYVALKDPNYRIARQITVNASATVVFPYINSAEKMNDWMPWKDMDPELVMSHRGPESGVGSSSHWTSPGKMGVGSSTLIESVEPKYTRFRLVYEKPFSMTQMSTISIENHGDTSVVEWSVTGKNNYMGRLMCVFMNMDKLVGQSFEQGLANLKKIVESPSK